MLVLSVRDGDVVVVQTPLGPVSFHVTVSSRHRRIGIDAKREWKVSHLRNGEHRSENAKALSERPPCTANDSAASRVNSIASRRARAARKGAPEPRGASAS